MSSPSSATTTHPLTLILDELREPSNLGGILRTAAAVGVSQVLLMKGMLPTHFLAQYLVILAIHVVRS